MERGIYAFIGEKRMVLDIARLTALEDRFGQSFVQLAELLAQGRMSIQVMLAVAGACMEEKTEPETLMAFGMQAVAEALAELFCQVFEGKQPGLRNELEQLRALFPD
jgi:hypothetical protein